MRNRWAFGRNHAYCAINGVRKIRHKTLADAKAFRRLRMEERGGPDEYSRIYKCVTCKGYHLTTKRKWVQDGTGTVWRDPDRTKKDRRSRDILPYSEFIRPLIGDTPWNSSPSKRSLTG